MLESLNYVCRPPPHLRFGQNLQGFDYDCTAEFVHISLKLLLLTTVSDDVLYWMDSQKNWCSSS